MPANLSGKKIIVTGGATGIGRASAERVAQLGARVAIFDTNSEAGKEAVDQINNGGGGTARFWSVDVRDEANVSGSVKAAKMWMEGVNVLLHFAGVLQGASVPLNEFTEETWDTVLDINLRGTFVMAKYVVAEMRGKLEEDIDELTNRAKISREEAAQAMSPEIGDYGVIILAASGAGVKGGSSSYAYGASKGGVHGFTMVMQQYLGEFGIRVNDIAPGSVSTPLKIAQIKESARIAGRPQDAPPAIEGLTSPADVAEIVAFMASDEAKLLKGTVFTG